MSYQSIIYKTYSDSSSEIFMIRLIIKSNALLLSLPNNVWRLIVFAPFLVIIIIIILFLSVDHELVHGRSQELLDRIGPKVFSFVVKGVKVIF
jgi:hypothetical protein